MTIDPDPLDRATWDSISLDAYTLVHGDRGDTYGPPWEDYERTTAIFAAITGIDLTVEEALLFMVAVKLSRLAHGLDEQLPADALRDSIVDGAGYLDCLYGALTRPDNNDLEDDLS